MLTESLNYPRNSEEWVKTVVIGGVLSLLSVFLIPTFLVVGYLLRVLRATMHEDEEPPVFDEWGDLFVDGVKGFVVGAVYFLIPALLATVVAVFGFAGAGSDSGAIRAIGGLVGLVGLLLVFVFGLLAAYVVPAALANYAEHDRLGAAFDVGTLREVVLTGQYATAWVTAFAVLLGASIVTGLLNVVPFLGFVLGAFVTFYAAVAAYYIYGHAWSDLHPVDLREEGETPEESAAV